MDRHGGSAGAKKRGDNDGGFGGHGRFGDYNNKRAYKLYSRTGLVVFAGAKGNGGSADDSKDGESVPICPKNGPGGQPAFNTAAALGGRIYGRDRGLYFETVFVRNDARF